MCLVYITVVHFKVVMTKKKNVDSNFFKVWSREMAYVLGFFLADGTFDITKRGGYYFGFNIVDKELLYQLRATLSSEHKISKRLMKGNESQSYRLQIGNKEICQDLLRLGVSPRKTLQLSVPEIPRQYIFDLVRGYFDGDGNVWFGYINKNRDHPTFVLQLTFTSGSVSFIKSLKDLLNKQGIQGGSLYIPKDKNYARLTFSTLSALQLAEKMYKIDTVLVLNRKREQIDRFIFQWKSLKKV